MADVTSDPTRQTAPETALRAVLQALATAKGQAAAPAPTLRDALRNLEASLAGSAPVKRAGLAVTTGLGTGRLAPTPWAALVRGEGAHALEGVFPVYRFRRDGSGVYLGLGQDFTAAEKLLGVRDGLAYLRQRALGLRRSLMTLATRDFVLDDRMDLRAPSGRSADHPSVTVAYRFYPTEGLPSDSELLRDLEVLVAVYLEAADKKTRPRRREPAAWIFCANPAQVDLSGAIRQLDRIHFEARGPAVEVLAGDRAYLAESGEEPGIMALATVLCDPDELPLPEAEKKFLRRPEAAPAEATRVALRIDRVLPERVTRAALAVEPCLAALPLGRPGAGAVIPLAAEAASALATLVQAASAVRFSYPPAVEALAEELTARSFVFEPWQVAAYVAALRTKPFVILAGVSGTGKSKLPRLVAEATGGQSRLLSVRPDWTDSSDLLGYVDLQGRFRPGLLLELAREATQHPSQHYVAIVDEMNLARVEHYFAEVLSRIEDRRPGEHGGFDSSPLLGQKLGEGEVAAWRNIGLPANLALVGTVNMDESAHGFSRKVLDRAFTLELSDVDLARWSEGGGCGPPARWPVEAWYPRAIQLGTLGALEAAESQIIDRVVEVLGQVNRFLIPAQLQVGYRVRDEMALFLLHAREFAGSFITSRGEPVDPLDLALHMKVLPRLVGGSAAIRRLLLALLGWAIAEEPLRDEALAAARVDSWEEAGRPSALAEARFPRTAARLALMWDRLQTEGFTSYWL